MAKKPGGLGKGINAFFSEEIASVNTDGRELLNIDINLIDPKADQPRRQFDDVSLNELAQSIEQHGVISPIILREGKGGRYDLIAGERRWRAARLAGLDSIPAIIMDADDKKRMELALIENIQREDLNPIEEAYAIKALIEQYGITQEELSSRIGMSRPAISNSIRLTRLESDIQALVINGDISAGHARALITLPHDEQLVWAEKAKELTVRGLENEIKAAEQAKKAKPKKRPAREQDAELERFGQELSDMFGAKVTVRGGLDSGSIRIDYKSREALERIYDILKSK